MRSGRKTVYSPVLPHAIVTRVGLSCKSGFIASGGGGRAVSDQGQDHRVRASYFRGLLLPFRLPGVTARRNVVHRRLRCSRLNS